jgi:hypothetical protein
VTLGAELGRALAREAVGRQPLADAAAMLAELLAELTDEPEVTVTAPAEHADELRAALPGIAARAGCSALLEVRADPALLAGELRLAWRDGWAERLRADLETRAAEALAALAGAAVPRHDIVETLGIAEDVT